MPTSSPCDDVERIEQAIAPGARDVADDGLDAADVDVGDLARRRAHDEQAARERGRR